MYNTYIYYLFLWKEVFTIMVIGYFAMVCIILNITHHKLTREGGDSGLFITLVPKVLYSVFLFVGLTTLATFIEFCLVGTLSWVFFLKFQPLVVIYKRVNFVSHHWVCKSFYQPLPYPLDPREPTNQNSTKLKMKMFSQQSRKFYKKKLGTSVINSPVSPPYLVS